jgi:hypothetical protein
MSRLRLELSGLGRALIVAPLSNCTNTAAASRGSGGGFCEKLLASTATMAPGEIDKSIQRMKTGADLPPGKWMTGKHYRAYQN